MLSWCACWSSQLSALSVWLLLLMSSRLHAFVSRSVFSDPHCLSSSFDLSIGLPSCLSIVWFSLSACFVSKQEGAYFSESQIQRHFVELCIFLLACDLLTEQIPMQFFNQVVVAVDRHCDPRQDDAKESQSSLEVPKHTCRQTHWKVHADGIGRQHGLLVSSIQHLHTVTRNHVFSVVVKHFDVCLFSNLLSSYLGGKKRDSS